ncbi:hypothetical protein AAEU32_13730 [Pseudoalteromonas sp. SSDWG2]|uniref:hypothetical protein n=1 Tax=Pseudoalteromonas sp. SSDWG2 TaxID=3139391 RepID=UPI003BAB8E1C
MKRINCGKFIRILGVTLISAATLYGFSTAPVHASLFQKPNAACMAQQAGFDLNCTAKDIRVTSVDNIRGPNGESSVSCTIGTDVSFIADVSITTTANQRYDYSVYLPEGDWSAQEYSTTNTCSILLGETSGPPGVDLEEGADWCADISKAAGYDATQIHTNQPMTLYCRDDDQDGYADFNYCAAWHNKEGADCSEDNPAAPGTPSKCRCDVLPLEILIKPQPPVITKTLTSASSSLQEPGGEFTFSLNIQNPNAVASLYVTDLSDLIEQGNNGFNTTLDLWGATSNGNTDGIYLTSTNCTEPVGGLEIAPGASYSCSFTVKIIDTDLPNDQSPELYNDVILAAVDDQLGNPVNDGDNDPSNDSCDIAGVDGYADGEHCSNVKQVSITNKAPAIAVSKTARVDAVDESGARVTYDVVVSIPTEPDNYYDSPLTITSLTDKVDGVVTDLTTLDGDCEVGVEVTTQSPYSCEFTVWVGEGVPGNHINYVTVEATDNEQDTATATDSETVIINNVLPSIGITKTPTPSSIDETGDNPNLFRDVDYTFGFSVSGEDSVTFSHLEDDRFGDLTADCLIDMFDDGDDNNGTVGLVAVSPFPLVELTLEPDQSATCTITRSIQGTPSTPHNNIAYAEGTEEEAPDTIIQSNVASAVVNFNSVGAAASMKFATNSLIVIEIANAGLYNATLDALTVGGAITYSVFDEEESSNFRLVNSGGWHNGVEYYGCVFGQALGYVGSGTDTYECAFNIEWEPGLENTEAIGVFETIQATLKDSQGNSDTINVGIQLATNEGQ